MSWSDVRRARSALVLAVLVLPWIASSRSVEGHPERLGSIAADTATIESSATIELVISDRPTVSALSKRTDGLRLPSAAAPAGLGILPASSFAWPAWRSDSIGWSAPIALHLAGRGPPSTVDS